MLNDVKAATAVARLRIMDLRRVECQRAQYLKGALRASPPKDPTATQLMEAIQNLPSKIEVVEGFIQRRTECRRPIEDYTV